MWHLDEIVITINGRKHFLWRAVDQDGFVLDVLIQNPQGYKGGQTLDLQAAQETGLWAACHGDGQTQILCGCQQADWSDRLRSSPAQEAQQPSGEFAPVNSATGSDSNQPGSFNASFPFMIPLPISTTFHATSSLHLTIVIVAALPWMRGACLQAA
jgi:DDE domain